ncbi:MmcQ/YjbR family DNA-binding protein [Acinetobacter sp. NIPH1876]|uniref:MmcQ/YjbR family DNA-binding protein n=1 Tax=Acinetobacter TaxID=469 RepID=UPI001F4B19F4|nr:MULTISPECIES: MmcQ/YjbR family DNA-binding protein [Acinetobacter]MCH7295851.1 MmcQ/YjbR family DNA-binding protein [Acinetobacter higginsii]MCH7339439.1 MmcQ/YjbR family DNA-binding protein [Acinetobacter higginsii]MCJ0827776.1 MmcQ/YjbR family DNA-binding protein [Acinetobacter sp. NIPH1876]
MNDDQLEKCALEYGQQLAFSIQSQPFGPDCEVFKVFDKVFMLIGAYSGKLLVTIKCKPEKSLEYQELYPSISAGYHMNKKHWISIASRPEITADLLQDLIKDSYDLVVGKLPLKDRKRIQNV